ncbi:ribosome maturation factor RimM [Wolbachia endosymbiont of Howardula sp.]|uniref:ribosome maturation factor RimM n=1 Tax=Wolbachia endosymbiont of Howardula sp. TaxID=2916816 RepID=UPI0031FC49E1
MNNHLICLGMIISPHGIHGAVKIRTFTEYPENISLYGILISDFEKYEINSLSVIGWNLVIAKISHINSYDDASLLKSKKLYITRNTLPKLNISDHYYYDDLLNMEVRLHTLILYGYVVSIDNFGSGDILKILMVKNQQHIMLPFTQDIFPYLNIKKKYMIVNLPEFIDSLD